MKVKTELQGNTSLEERAKMEIVVDSRTTLYPKTKKRFEFLKNLYKIEQ
jgi:hypothetical protein